jgi:hypothetical protein
LKIYIYGNQSFKKEIHETLEHSNIKFKLDTTTIIEEINSLTKLKAAINENPNDIYLIDDEKIIKKNSLNKKLKFLTPKDGIEEEYLLDSGIADLSIDSLSELPKYIIKRYEELKLLEPNNIEPEENDVEEIEQSSIELDEELAQLLSKGDTKKQDLTPTEDFDDIFGMEKDINLDDLDDIIGKVDFNSDENKSKEVSEFDDIVNFNDNFGLNNISLDYDDNDVLYREESDEDLSDTTPKESIDIFKELDFLGEEVEEDDTEEIMDLEKINNDLFGGFDFLNEEIQEGKKVVEEEIDTLESNPFSDFDFLNDDLDEEEIIKDKKLDNEDEKVFDDELFNEFDFSKEERIQSRKNSETVQGAKMSDEFFELDSLNEKDLLEALSYNVGESSSVNEYKPMVSESKNETLSIDSSNVNDLSVLISKLLTNKTLEITIKIKD